MISRRTDYALRALSYLAKRKNEWTSASQLSGEIKVSKIFLAKIFQPLIQNGVLESQRGREGGVRVVKKDAKLSEIILMFEPDFALNKCLAGNYHCSLQEDCSLHGIFGSLQAELMKKLSGITLRTAANRKGGK